MMYAVARRIVLVALLGCESPFAWTGTYHDASPDADAEIVIRDWLVIERVGQYGRSATHTDAIEREIVGGRWSPPQAGATVTLPDGTTRTWQPATAADNGLLEHPALQGGYAYAAVAADSDRIMILDARGHSMAYVNGAPRGGDIYQTGWTRLPVELHAGQNTFLFPCGRGALQAQLVPTTQPVCWALYDLTLPDLIVGENIDTWGALPLINAQAERLESIVVEAIVDGGPPTRTPAGPVLPLTTRKIGFALRGPAPTTPGPATLRVRLLRVAGTAEQELAATELQLAARAPTERCKRTFVSSMDGSVQYYAVTPAHPPAADEQPLALFLTLHGAAVEATNQAAAYGHKDWGHLVAPTNRRPYGFDWEDWGRRDALEVLDLESRRLGTDPLRTYLLGHSMGGHGVWQVGAHFPDRFAAIAPSAGWLSFRSYLGAAQSEPKTPLEQMLRRAESASATLLLSRNYLHFGVYVLHGELDDDVPVREARSMRAQLGEYHADFAYYERPGAGHWWGAECVDWPPLFDFLRRHVRPATSAVRRIEFVTVNPGISATSHWVTIVAQEKESLPSSVTIELDAATGKFSGTTDNVARLSLDLAALRPSPSNTPSSSGPSLALGRGSLTVALDGQTVDCDSPLASEPRLWLGKADGQWAVTPPPPLSEKGPHRYGPFKDAFDHRFMFVYGTAGTPEENAANFNKARYDAEVFGYRGNGSVDVWPDTAFNAAYQPDRGVILYGNSTTNVAWPVLVGDSPVQVERGTVRVGERHLTGDDLACLIVRPRPGSDNALVGVVAGTGVPGMRLTERIPYFLAGVALPDCLVLGAASLAEGVPGVHAAGFFGRDWSLAPGAMAWPE